MRILTPEGRNAPLVSLDEALVVEAIREQGVVLFHGFAAGRPEFVAFTERFASNFETYKGGAFVRRKLSRDGSVLAATGEGHGWRVPAHGEMYYNALRPELLWFFCESPPVSRGETFVCDGRRVLNHLSAGTRRFLDEKRLLYERKLAHATWTRIYQTSELADVETECKRRGLTMVAESDGSITTRFLTPAVVDGVFINNILPIEQQEELGLSVGTVRLEDGSRIPARLLMEIEDAIDATTELVAWQRSDLLVVDNRRFLHGRRAYSAPRRRRIAVRLSDRSFAS